MEKQMERRRRGLQAMFLGWLAFRSRESIESRKSLQPRVCSKTVTQRHILRDKSSNFNMSV